MTITEKELRELIKNLREAAKMNRKLSEEASSEFWSGHRDGRDAAYTVAAGWLEELVEG